MMKRSGYLFLLALGWQGAARAQAKLPNAAEGAAQNVASMVKEENLKYQFNPLLVKRDPFFPPDANRFKNLDDIVAFDLSEIKLVAIMTGSGPGESMFVLPNGKVRILQANDKIGNRNGSIIKVDPKYVQIREQFKDFSGRVKTLVTELKLGE